MTTNSMVPDDRAGRRSADPSLTKLARDVGRLSNAFDALSKAQQDQARAFSEHVEAYQQHVDLDRQRNGRIEKGEARVAALETVTYQRLSAMEEGAAQRTLRLDELHASFARQEGYLRAKAEFWLAVKDTAAKVLPAAMKAAFGGAGAALVALVGGYVTGVFGG